MRRTTTTVGSSGLLVLALASPVIAAWAVTGTGTGAAGADRLASPGVTTLSGVTSSAVTLSWGAPPTGPQPAHYVVRRNGTAVTTGGCAAPTTTSCTDSGLTAGTQY